MDQSNYVGQTGAGYVVVKGGQVVGTYPTQSAAEQAYNGGGGGGAAPTNNGPVYQTRNGPRTLQQMTAELQSAGGNPDPSNPDAVFAMYQGVDPNGVGGGAAGGTATGGNTAVNIAAANLAAQTAYQTALIAGMSDRLAFDRATEAWNETFKQKQADVSQGNTVVDQQFRQGQANNTNALSYLGLQSNLAGRPANAFEYAKLLTGTPGGLADIVRAAGGAYQLPQFGGGAPGNPTPLTIQSMIADLNRYAPTGGGQAPTAAPPGATAPPATTGAPGTYNTVNGVKTVAEMAQELHVAGWGGNYNDPAAVAAAYGATTKGAVTPNVAAPVPAPVGAPTTAPPAAAVPPANPGAGAQSNPIPASMTPPTSQYIPQYGDVPRGNQIAPQNWNIMDPSQQALLLDTIKQPGWLPEDIMASYQRSLKAYGGPQAGAVGF